MLKDHNTIEEALKLLNQKNNEVAFSELKTGIDAAVAKIKGELTAEVQTATDLTDSEKSKLESAISSLFGKDTTILYRTNKKLLGGFKVAIGDWKFDASLATQLDTMRKQLGGSHG